MKYLIVLLLMIGSFTSNAQSPKFYEDISPLIYNKCTKCHRSGEIKEEIPLTNYTEVSNYASTIKYVTNIKYMPPWKPNHEYSNFQGENYLTDAQIKLIADWVDAGTPAGDPTKEAPKPFFPIGSQLGTPDLVVNFSQGYKVKSNNKDEYRVFVLPSGLTQNKDIAAVEFRPGNLSLVHHALISQDTTGQAKILDAKDPEYGYLNFGGFGVNSADENMFPGYVPGTNPRFYPDGVAQPMFKKADVLVQVHYAPTPIGGIDSSTVNFFYSKKPVQRYVYQYTMLPFDIVNGPFVIPAKQVKTFHGEFEVPFKVSLLSIWPHCHLLGKEWKVFAIHPNGDTTNLIQVQDWDFNWQGGYSFKKYQILDPGTVIHAYATYDNTSNNPLNPNNPPKTVTWGEKTTDEMYYLPLSFVLYQPGDENVIFNDNTVATNGPKFVKASDKLFPISPNPIKNDPIQLAYRLYSNSQVRISLLDMNGREIMELINEKNQMPGEHIVTASIQNVPSGQYLVQLQTSNSQSSQTIQVVR